MSVLLHTSDVLDRGNIAFGPLEPLTQSLTADLRTLLGRDLYFPREKALLSREGGRCARDGTLLDFDPFQPHEHRCPTCGQVYRGELHDRFWIYWYQLWLAERAVHASVLTVLNVDDRFAGLAAHILEGYVERYQDYPNADNVLGPTRLFFSTYLESIWLLQICIAADLLEEREPWLVERVRERIVEPSRAIIREYNEGGSNRQVWNNAGLLAAAQLLGDPSGAREAVYGNSGITSQLATGLLPDGTWYEGENYHLFAHRGLWYGVTMAECAELEMPAPLIANFERGFAAPFATALPDFTLPSRRDSQYAISLRQWRIAEHCELGLARVDDDVLLGALSRMYRDDIPRRPTGRDRSSADVERNAPASALTRADLSWRALLFARPTLPAFEPPPPRSVLLAEQGIAVFRRDGARVYAALDYGRSGGGHGHPDRLNLLLAVGDQRWLDDFGTGSYVDPSLHWYRSTLAHNAPLVDGHSQLRVDGTLGAYDERGGAGWVTAVANGVAPETNVRRTIVVMPAYVVDSVVWESERAVTVDLPLHADLKIVSGGDEPVAETLTGGDGTEDGYRFVRDTTRQNVVAGASVVARAKSEIAQLDLFTKSSAPVEWWHAVAPGPPGRGDHDFVILRARAAHAEHRLVWSWAGDVAKVEFGETVRVVLADGSVHEHRPTDDGWHIDLVAGSARSSIDLGGLLAPATAGGAVTDGEPRRTVLTVPMRRRSLLVELGESHYRRSEQSWRDAGAPTASVTLVGSGPSMEITVEVHHSDLTFAPASAENRYDNESADINGDGVQLFARTKQGLSGWILVPESESSAVRVRQIEGWNTPQNLAARWERTGDGYTMHVTLTATDAPDAIDVVVNEMPRGRERRRGQLVMSGAVGEFIYLRGDRHEASRLITLRFADD